jgi:hypothetical protein
MTPDASTAASLAARIAHLPQLSWADLKAEWKHLFGQEPTITNRRFVEKRVAYRWQEIEFRKVDRNLLERNQRRIDELIETGSLGRFGPGRLPAPGTVLSRWHGGVEHRVTIQAEDRFEYQSRSYGSLSVIAREITGTRWSGPAFFGLRTRAKR